MELKTVKFLREATDQQLMDLLLQIVTDSPDFFDNQVAHYLNPNNIPNKTTVTGRLYANNFVSPAIRTPYEITSDVLESIADAFKIGNYLGKGNKVEAIKALRNEPTWNYGLKETKDVIEWLIKTGYLENPS